MHTNSCVTVARKFALPYAAVAWRRMVLYECFIEVVVALVVSRSPLALTHTAIFHASQQRCWRASLCGDATILITNFTNAFAQALPRPTWCCANEIRMHARWTATACNVASQHCGDQFG